MLVAHGGQATCGALTPWLPTDVAAPSAKAAMAATKCQVRWSWSTPDLAVALAARLLLLRVVDRQHVNGRRCRPAGERDVEYLSIVRQVGTNHS